MGYLVDVTFRATTIMSSPAAPFGARTKSGLKKRLLPRLLLR